MTSRAGHYVEALTREDLERLRATDTRFRYAHISRAFQAWDDLIIPGTIYPPGINTRGEFSRYNAALTA